MTVMKRRPDSDGGWERMSVESKTRKMLKRLVRIFRELTETGVLQWAPPAQSFEIELTNVLVVRGGYFHIWPGKNSRLPVVYDLTGKDVKDLIKAVGASVESHKRTQTVKERQMAQRK